MTGPGIREPGSGITREQAAEEFKRLRGVEPFGPFIPLLASPELMTRVSALGEYLRYRSALPPRLSEFAILVTASIWQQEFEWEIHAPIALKAGISQRVVDALSAREAPPDLTNDEQAVYDLCTELHRDRRLSGPTHARARAELGEQGTIDAIAICGYYALLAMVLNSPEAR